MKYRATLIIGLVAGLFFISPVTFSQTIIKGNVIDKITKEPLELAVINNESTEKNTFTDKHGNFILKKAANDSSTIFISFIGYKSQQIKINPSQKSVLVEMEKGVLDLKEIIITNNASISTYHTLSSIDLNMQPANSAQDLLRLVPGLFIAQHQGGGKAEQIFLRGFDADHGTDVNVSVDGLPVNMVSQAHGQGYADLHFLIPETVAGYDFGKGPYYANYGDFTTAGYVAYNTMNFLDKNVVKLEGGQFNTGRILAMINLLGEKAKQKQQSAYIAGEALYSDGPFDYPEHFSRFNLFGKFITPISEKSKLIFSASTLSSGWRASGEIPNRAVAEGYIPDRFGVIDSAQGGYTSRTNINLKLISTLKNNFTWENQAFYSYYFFNLVSNFTFYYFYPQTGDEFRQHESRNLMGYKSKISHQTLIGNNSLTSSAGIGIRYDDISPSYLAHTINGNTILNYIQLGKIHETNVNGFVDETYETGNWLFNASVRIDYLHFYYLNMAPASDTSAAIYNGANPTAQKTIVSPKINIQYTVNPQLQFYVKTGKGFHSNDARIVIANRGYQILPAAYGADFGVNWKPISNLFINTALWYLYLQQEFTYGADLGDQAVSPGGKTKREGIDFSFRYQFNHWLYGFMNIDLARPRAIGEAKGQNYLPLAPTCTSTGGLDVRFNNGINGSISYRYMHNRAANEDYTLTALGYWVTDLTVNYTRKKYEVGISVENLFNVSWNESQFEYISRLKNETQPVDEVSYTPGTPFFAKLKFSIFF